MSSYSPNPASSIVEGSSLSLPTTVGANFEEIPFCERNKVEFAGWLWVRSSLLTGWKNKYFKLNGSMLSYFDAFPSQEYFKTNNTVFRHISEGTAPRCVIRVAHVQESRSNKLGFKVYGSNGQFIDIRASKLDGKLNWMKALTPEIARKTRSWSVSQNSVSESDFHDQTKIATTSRTCRLSIPITKSGWMLKRSDYLKKWNRYYFVLQDSMLSYYASNKPYDVPRRRGYILSVGPRGQMEMLVRLGCGSKLLLHVDGQLERERWLSLLKSNIQKEDNNNGH